MDKSDCRTEFSLIAELFGERAVEAVDVVAEDGAALLVAPRGDVEDVDGHVVVETYVERGCPAHSSLDPLRVPLLLFGEEVLREPDRVGYPDAARAVRALSALEEVLRRRVVQVDKVSIWEDELDLPQRVRGSRILSQDIGETSPGKLRPIDGIRIDLSMTLEIFGEPTILSTKSIGSTSSTSRSRFQSGWWLTGSSLPKTR